MPPKERLYSDRDYLEARFSTLDEKLDIIHSNLSRLDKIEEKVAKAEGAWWAATGIATAASGVIAWVVSKWQLHQ